MLDDTTIKVLNHFKARILNRYGEAEFILFGSRARGDHRPDSDADVAVILAGEPLPPYKTKMDMAKIAFDVLLDDELLISPLPLWRQEWENPDQYNNPLMLLVLANGAEDVRHKRKRKTKTSGA
ncbi:MAG: nucleotidyltransferase domain-containing protein [Marinospirillum sp.]|nr:nucleotidyltransferase domain-containing protein [Marinospirillum sp.]